jgi:LPS-assembly lipoprotein
MAASRGHAACKAHQRPGKAGSAVARALALCVAVILSGCGFQLRGAPSFAFTSIYINVAPASSFGKELRNSIASSGNLKVLADPAQLNSAQVVLDITGDQREKVAVSLNTTGQVTEFQLRTRIKFKLRTPQGKELIAETELLQQRDMSFSESAALSKEAEEGLLYRDMQSDIVQQLMRRLAAVKTI